MDRANENRLAAKPLPGCFPAKLPAPVKRALAIAEITDLETLASYSEKKILALHGIGTRAIPTQRAALKEFHRFFDTRKDALPANDLEVLLETPIWKEIMDMARETLEAIKATQHADQAKHIHFLENIKHAK